MPVAPTAARRGFRGEYLAVSDNAPQFHEVGREVVVPAGAVRVRDAVTEAAKRKRDSAATGAPSGADVGYPRRGREVGVDLKVKIGYGFDSINPP